MSGIKASALADRARAGNGRYLPLGLILGLVVLVADQASKWWILDRLDLPVRGRVTVLPVLDFVMVWNHAVTFGLFGGVGAAGRFLFSAVALAVVVMLLFWMRRTPKPWVAAALGAIAGGAIGNVIDRLRFGAVVDFIHAHLGSLSWNYIFNLADASIVCGVGVLLIDSLFDRPPKQQ
ncbi:signal peptidase II [Lichenicola cladoniae]|uniref:Lipoprotein signal peptidase n=1 Tax=Lichenicola cladoniae TaxID=1484109 RepID=A0A6M8HTE9_9PROT|nr:signal peptidase II [Lichenicola cladoniae]NPD65361.1 signal peptidase II [Acetobacteraceae bacterium]QKE91556.1 signal peptidase II [Lichenicola cladoniae]